ncbi:hypothetical protein [Azospirillum rugosum]|uniref:Membrane protein YfhO n=1 Tax=Azospirillum rugosum TaxID=416170 RepID=A0ABS4SP94_9PROT|nr:hypothetical protein [Azospirillum rugosum]MBP2294377.1 hypothetical protein [Azospirillum rugosum]MDQ0527712.1 hypothetical protein [Azospirillum rugosum]
MSQTAFLRPSSPGARADLAAARLDNPAWHGLAAAVVLFGLNVALFPGHWSGVTSFTFDFFMHYYAVAAYWMASVGAGEWPHWVPYQSYGYPLAMNLQAGIHYPPFWFFPASGIPYDLHAANIVQLLHVYAGALGMYRLTRVQFRSSLIAFLAAVCYHLYGGFFTNAEHPDIVRAFALFPWLFWAFLLADRPGVPLRLKGFAYTSTLRWRSLLIPPLLYLFIVGSYPGCMIAGLLCLSVFVLVQVATAVARRQGSGVLLDAAVLGGLTLIGVAMAAAYLLPGFRLSGELVRSAVTQQLARQHLSPEQLGSLLYSSAGLGPDMSMLGMQIPVVVAIFLPFLRPSDLLRHLSFLAVGAVAAVMCLSTLAPLSSALVALVPPLGYSRFAAGDYRTLLYMAVLFLALSGFDNLRRSPEPLSRQRLIVLAGTAFAVVLGGVLCLILVVPDAWAPFFRSALMMQAAVLAVTLAVLAWMRRWPRPRLALSLIVPVLAAVSAWPVLDSMSSYWKTPLPIGMYEANGIRDRLGNEPGNAGLFRKPLAERPARLAVPRLLDLSWRGYFTGDFMTADLTGSLPKNYAVVESDPALKSFMMQPSRLLAFDCARVACDQPAVDGVDLNDATGSAEADVSLRTLSFARNGIVHDIALPRRMLVVENEAFAPGWTAKISGAGNRLEPVRVNGALRGWVLPAGHYQLSTSYQTPLFRWGMGISLAMLAAWLLAVGVYARARRSARTVRAPAAQTAAA